MDYKKIVAEEIQKLVSEHLTYDQVYQLLEVPKYTEHGDVAFPAFALAKALRKAPQAIAGDLAAQLNHPYIEKVEAVGPYVICSLKKQRYRMRSCMKLLPRSKRSEQPISAKAATCRSICPRRISRNRSRWGICVLR